MFDVIKALFGSTDEHEDGMPVERSVTDGFIDGEQYEPLGESHEFECSVPSGGIVELDTPKVGWKYFKSGRIARLVIPAGATVVFPKYSRKLRTDKAYLDAVFLRNRSTATRHYLGDETDDDIVRGYFSDFEYHVGSYYEVETLNTDTSEVCEADGIYFYANRAEAVSASK